jgi:cell division protein FtsL
MPRKIRVEKKAPARTVSRAEIVLYIVMAIIAVSMVFGTIFSAVSR